MADIDEVRVATCTCDACEGYTANWNPTVKENFTFTTPKKDFKFPAVVNPTPERGSNYAVIIGIFEDKRLTAADKLRDAGDVIWHLTYIDIISKEVALPDYVGLCEYLLDVNLDAVIQDEKLAADFLRRITSFFVLSWYSVAVAGDGKAEWAARQFRNLLTHMLGFPIICRQVKNVFCNPEYWPVVSPLDMFESHCKHNIFCLRTLSLLVNFTRIDLMCFEIQKSTACLKYIEDQYTKCCSSIQCQDDLGGLMLLLFMNLTCIPEFLKFLVENNGGYFMNVILVDLISNPCNYKGLRAAAWPFLRNLSLLEKGREQIINNLELYLGHVLYPIAGPEQLTDEESENIPLEVQLLPETKKRVENKKIRECILDILYSLCRYKKDRIKLREADVYQILKHYHKVETDENLLEKLENVVNVLIRHEGSEIEVDDLLEGLKQEDKEPLQMLTPPLSLVPTNRSQNEPSQSWKPESRTEPKERNFKPDRAIVIIDDDDDFESENMCTSEFIPEDTSSFNYYELHQFHRLRKLLYHVQKEIRITQSTKISSQLSDEFVKKKFFNLYGPVNYDGQFMQSRWEVIRETINEIKIQPDLHEITSQLLEEEIDDDEDEELIQAEEILKITINQRYNTEEQHKYKRLNPHVGNGDWFKLPRPDLSSIRQQYFPDSDEISALNTPKFVNSLSVPSQHTRYSSAAPSKTSYSSSNHNVYSRQSGEGRNKLDLTSAIKPLTNLHVYDPKFEFCYNRPYLILRQETETIEIPKMLSVRIVEHINRFPLGVSTDMFWEKFYKVNDYLPRLPDVPRLDKLLSLYDPEIYFVKGVDKLPLLMFPSVLEGVVHPEQILKRVWHLIKCIFGSRRCPWLYTENLLNDIKYRYGLDFDPLDWDFPSVNHFLTFCIQNFGCTKILTVYRQNYTEQHVSKFEDFFMINSEFLKDKIATLYGVSKTPIERRKPRKPMPKTVVRSGTKIDFVTNHLSIGETYDLDIKVINNYNHLSCVLLNEYDFLWEFHESLQEQPLRFIFDMAKQPDPDHLNPGTFVMAYRGFAKSKVEAKWYRAKILWKHPTLAKYYVYGIDFGFMQYVELKDLRYMPKEEVSESIAHSIPIELVVQNPLSEDWNKDVSVIAFNKLLRPFDYLRATLIEQKFDNILGCTKWIAKAHLYKLNNKKRYRGDFGHKFEGEYKRRFELRRKPKENAKDGSNSKEIEGKPEAPLDASVSTN